MRGEQGSAGSVGRVVLVGGGPGALDLITVRGLDRLLEADVVIYDRLAPVGLLDRLGPDVERIDAARSPGSRTLTYDEIVAVMIDRARAGKAVVRLKGGDPFVLAHGAQEVDSCTAAGIAVEVVPGITSAIAGPVLAGIPLTSTEGAAGFTVVSGHLAPDAPGNPLDWTALAHSRTTIVVLMGVRQVGAIAARLIADGLPAPTPVTCVADVSLGSQRVVRSTLATVAADVTAAGVSNPAVIVIEAAPRTVPRRVLVLGGSRSGKSAYAESLAGDQVDYLATAAPLTEDAEWDARIAAHRARRDPAWTTIETGDVAAVLDTPGPTALVDSVTAWLTRTMDEHDGWADEPSELSRKSFDTQLDRLVDAWIATSRSVILVSDEVGGGIVPATASGRRFRDALGSLNQRLAARADAVYLVTAGIAQRLK